MKKLKENIIKLPTFPPQESYTTETFLDNFEIETLNQSLIKSMLEMKKISEKLDSYSRRKVEKEAKYKCKYRSYLLKVEGKTEAQKKLLAEIYCEKEEIEIAYLDEVIKELTRHSYVIKQELEVLKILGNNIRMEMKI